MLEKGCWFRETFGLYCPGCGGTRMLRAILQLNFYQAFRYNPLIFLLLVFMCICGCFNLYRLITHKNIIWPKERHFVTLAAVVVIYMILRNIPLFNFLIPTDV